MLTKQLVNSRSRRRARGIAAAGEASRDRLLAAAAAEFAARGFAGASVDRIAATARVNKAMIYYHFRSKAALYREILRDMFQAVEARVRGAAESRTAPDQKIRLFIEAIATEAEARPHFSPIWFREIAEGGQHLDAPVLRDIVSIVRTLAAIVAEGAHRAAFQRVNPLLVHACIVAPLLLFFASDKLRSRIEKSGLRGIGAIRRDEMIAHVQRVTLGVLEGRM
jgi:AcrR family transcriptional regulator